MQDTHRNGAVHVCPAFVLRAFSYIFREPANVYLNTANKAVPLEIVGAVESLWFNLSETNQQKLDTDI